MSNTPFRIGEGFDVHALVPGRKLIIGGVEIAHDKGLLGHSDADVLLHTITDALLGAAGLGDIGELFPDSDARFKGADSAQLLEVAYARVQTAGYALVNIDCTVIAERPKLGAHKTAIRENIARILKADVTQVNVKAKTTEKLGFTGREEGIAAKAVALLSHS